MKWEKIRRQVITALASSDELADSLVLKGGNAIKIAHQLGDRASLDLDYSMERDFENPEETRQVIEKALERRFAEEGLKAFDVKLTPKPEVAPDFKWGGYRLEFKLISEGDFEKYAGDLRNVRVRALQLTPPSGRSFRVDISKYEYVEERVTIVIDDYSVYVYSLDMIVAEKLRAICQQLPEYEKVAHPRARARDFYDIWMIVESGGASVTQKPFTKTLEKVFGAKSVPLSWIDRIKDTRSFHRTDWAGVTETIGNTSQEFDFYFDFVVSLIERLEASGIVHFPSG